MFENSRNTLWRRNVRARQEENITARLRCCPYFQADRGLISPKGYYSIAMTLNATKNLLELLATKVYAEQQQFRSNYYFLFIYPVLVVGILNAKWGNNFFQYYLLL